MAETLYWFPTSDEDSSTPDDYFGSLSFVRRMRFRPLTRIHLLLTYSDDLLATQILCFRPLTRIHLLLTVGGQYVTDSGIWFPTSDEDSSTPDTTRNCATIKPGSTFPTSDEDSSTPDGQTTSAWVKVLRVSDL